MRKINLAAGQTLTDDMLNRGGALPADVIASAAQIIETVRAGGDEAVRDYERRFDRVELETFRVPSEVLDRACDPDRVDPAFLASCEKAAAQIRDFHERELQQSWFMTRPDGTILGQMVKPLESVAIYVPGGRAQYPSTVLMNAIPAKVAGVDRIVMVTPPQRDGGALSPYTLCAAKVAGVDEIYTVGGAQAIAAVAYGTESIPRVSKVTGPGNAYVAAAKKLVSGDVGIDMVAGPSEVCVLADDTADARLVAIDLMAQAEHDPMAACYLVTTSEPLADEILANVERYVAQSPRREITEASLDNRGIVVVCPDMDTAIASVNAIAPEHLEVQTAEGMGALGKIRNAGAIFVGTWSSEPLGDYLAGPNHTLPTGGTAKFSSPLSVEQFVKKSSVIDYSYEGLQADCDDVVVLAEAEGLWSHARSAEMRRVVAASQRGEDVPADAGVAGPIAGAPDAPVPAGPTWVTIPEGE
jgi:histidinol dehydrogenase